MSKITIKQRNAWRRLNYELYIDNNTKEHEVLYRLSDTQAFHLGFYITTPVSFILAGEFGISTCSNKNALKRVLIKHITEQELGCDIVLDPNKVIVISRDNTQFFTSHLYQWYFGEFPISRYDHEGISECW